MNESFVQTLIALTSVVALYLALHDDLNYNMLAPLIGVVGQPFWAISSIKSKQWGILFVTIMYTLLWIGDLIKYWF